MMKNTPTTLTDAEIIAQEFKDFAYIVSHDLSGPLRGMVQFSQLLKAEQPDALNEEGKEYLSLIIESGEKLQNMLAGLLDYSRLNTMAKPFSEVNCNSILEHCRIVLKEKIETNKGELKTTPLLSVRADPEQLMQLFLLLLDNAFKFHIAGKAPHVEVSAKTDGKECVFIIRDNGIGIEPEFHARIFQPFQKLHADSEYPGVGMGLALAKKIVARHGGRIWVDSVPGKGSSFYFTLPSGEK